MAKFKSLLQTERECYRCHTTIDLDRHHIFNAANRRLSEADGCYIYLCRECHNYVHAHPKFMATYKARCEEAWLKYYDKTIEDFIKRYGKNYL